MWFNQRQVKTQKVPEPSQNGKPYRHKVLISSLKPREEWIAVPVPDARIPRQVVEAARDVIRDNHAPSTVGRRFWELSGGILKCGVCGNRMENRTVVKRSRGFLFYHSYQQHYHYGRDACSHKKNLRALDLEADVWGLVRDLLLLEPERSRVALDEMFEQERERMSMDPDAQVQACLARLAELGRKRSR